MSNIKLLVSLLVIAFSTSIVASQERLVSNARDGRSNVRGGQIPIFKHLGLSKEQIQQIRQIDRDSRPQRREAAIRFRQAKKDLDDAIYADVLDRESVQVKLRSFLEAQAQLVKMSRMNEIAVRSVLTSDQLVRFRALRARYAKGQKKRALRQRNMNRRGRPSQRNRRPDQQRP